MANIVFVIPVFNQLKFTRDCLEILDSNKTTPFFTKNTISVIVSDDGSTDNTADWIRSRHPDVIILQGTGNLWYSGSMNMGIRYGLDKLNADFIMVWENDTYPVEGYFDNLQNIIETWDGSSIICSKLYYRANPDVIFGLGGTFNPRTGATKLIGRQEKDKPEYNKTREMDWFLGQGVMIHRKMFEKVGLFDEFNFPQYYADIDFSLRAKKAGFHNIFYPSLKMLNDTENTGLTHLKNKTFRQFLDSLTSIKSNNNIARNLKFFRIHTTSPIAYYYFCRKYFVYAASFFKWKVLGLFGIKRRNEDLY